MRIGQLAERTGTNTPTIRYYEEIGLLPRPNREHGGQRSYDSDDVKRLTFIRQCREFGFPIGQVRTLATLTQDRERSCLEARDLAREQLVTVRARLAELKALEETIAELVRSCDATCAGGPGPDCIILEELSEPGAFVVTHRRRRVTA